MTSPAARPRLWRVVDFDPSMAMPRCERALSFMETARMDSTTTATRRISLFDSLADEWIKLPFKVMVDVGPAAQTLGGLLNQTNKETFVAAKAIAGKARLPLSTVRKHLVTLSAHGWIENAGRERTRSGRPRRTCTIRITQKTRDSLEPWGYLPWWACCKFKMVGRLPWSTKAVFSVVMARLCSLRSAAIESSPDTEFKTNAKMADGFRRHNMIYGRDEKSQVKILKWVNDRDEEMMGAIDNLGGSERFRFSLDELTRLTGLTRESVVSAKRGLCQHRLVIWTRVDGHQGADYLAPDHEFRVVQTPATPGNFWLTFARQ